jgi:hypothetical protein
MQSFFRITFFRVISSCRLVVCFSSVLDMVLFLVLRPRQMIHSTVVAGRGSAIHEPGHTA